MSLMPPPVEPGSRADEHQRDADEQARAGQVADRDRRHPGRAERDRLEQRVQRPLGGGSAPSVRGLDHSNTSSASIPPTTSATVITTTSFVSSARRIQPRFASEVAHDRDAEAAEDDQHRERDEHERVAREVAEAVEAAEQVEARVVERRDRVEHAVPRALRGVAVADRRSDRQRDRADALRDERERRHAPEDGPDRAEVAGARGLLGEHPVAERRPPADDEQEQQRGARS